jgi:hypothetical protein
MLICRRNNLDALLMPEEIEGYMPREASLYKRLRETETKIDNFLRNKFLDAKENLLLPPTMVKCDPDYLDKKMLESSDPQLLQC